MMKIQLLRHATLLVEYGGKTLLVDPMLSEQAAMPPIINSANDRRNPLTPLTAPANYLQILDAVLLTHTHRDHFDDAAAKLLPKNKPVLCQPADEAKLKELGFAAVLPIEDTIVWEGIHLKRTGGRHGTGEIGEKMAPVSGYVLSTAAEPTLYIAGDTIYCAEVETALADHKPEVIVINGGGARFTVGDPITMTAADAEAVLRFSPTSHVVIVHLDSINHCLETREVFHRHFANYPQRNRLSIPADGETLSFRK
jgi:L-ascorbate metabolism protein UlaG (beta-lactamase superfamily)